MDSSQINPIQIPINSTPLPELASYSTISTSNSSSPEHILNLPKSPQQSPNLPPIQHMNRSYDVPDPNRIPQSIFATKSSAPTEWSVASNESLFSIQLAKSGELGNIFGTHPELLQIGVPKDVIGGMKDGISGNLMELESQIQNQWQEKGQNGNFKEKAEMNVNVNTNHRGQIGNFSNMSTPCESPASGVSGRISETSTNSHSSFAFPVLTGDVNIKSHGESMQKLIQKEPVPVEPVPETPETGKSPPPQNGNWFSCFPCCTFTR